MYGPVFTAHKQLQVAGPGLPPGEAYWRVWQPQQDSFGRLPWTRVEGREPRPTVSWSSDRFGIVENLGCLEYGFSALEGTRDRLLIMLKNNPSLAAQK